MERFVKTVWTEERGNATLDWLVLTAGVVLLSAALFAAIGAVDMLAQEDGPPAPSSFDLQTQA